MWRGIIITATGDLDTSRDWRGYHCDYYFLRTGDMYLNLASDLSPGLEIIVSEFVSNDRGRYL